MSGIVQIWSPLCEGDFLWQALWDHWEIWPSRFSCLLKSSPSAPFHGWFSIESSRPKICFRITNFLASPKPTFLKLFNPSSNKLFVHVNRAEQERLKRIRLLASKVRLMHLFARKSVYLEKLLLVFVLCTTRTMQPIHRLLHAVVSFVDATV